MSESEGYNGWKNYETWNVALWLDNDEGSYNEVRRLARGVAFDHEDDDEDDVMQRQARGDLADILKDYVTENHVPELPASMASDLLNAALSEVDWYEMAEHYLDDIAE